eukprot:TRINITY_DN12704_c0_g1_i1.p1 TRINITY_DN12704_c0_g1~~TRINITY_DN12704_c0_g1_i1.p1  ORF type:complete len:579 (+),score=198.77 TRINITY_DN12704_c0_g1_i1:80-1816(+)
MPPAAGADPVAPQQDPAPACPPVTRDLSVDEWRAHILREQEGGVAEPIRTWKRPARPRAPPGACHRCGEEGHWARECPLPPGEDCAAAPTAALPPAPTPPLPCASSAERSSEADPEESAPPRRGLFSMPCRGRYTCDCEHTRRALAEEAACGELDADCGEWPTPQTKPRGFEFYEMLGRPKCVVAPMVEQSELSFRLLCKRYGAHLCYTPTINSSCFMKDPWGSFRNREYSTCPADTNMFAQICGNDPEIVVATARELQYSGCKAIDLNLGCPQGIAKKGYYGSFLMDDLGLVRSLVSALDQHISIPITVKIRCFPDPQHTVAYAQMLQDAGAAIVTVHGRLREQKGQDSGPADWTKIKLVKEALTVPVFANGGIWWHGDIERCLAETGADAVMCADTLLWDPRLFSRPARFIVPGRHFYVADPRTRIEGVRLALEYLDICATHPTQLSHMKSHVFKATHHSLHTYPEMRQRLGDIQWAQDAPPVRPQLYRFCEDLLRMEEAAIAAAPGAAEPPTFAQVCAGFRRLDGVLQPPGCALHSAEIGRVSCEADFRKRKEEKIQRMAEEEEEGLPDLFGECE